MNRDELVRKMGADPEFFRQTLEGLLQPLTEAEVTDRVGADRDRPYSHPHDLPEWPTLSRLGHPARDAASGDPQATPGA